MVTRVILTACDACDNFLDFATCLEKGSRLFRYGMVSFACRWFF
jgi:hypothetical protein